MFYIFRECQHRHCERRTFVSVPVKLWYIKGETLLVYRLPSLVVHRCRIFVPLTVDVGTPSTVKVVLLILSNSTIGPMDCTLEGLVSPRRCLWILLVLKWSKYMTSNCPWCTEKTGVVTRLILVTFSRSSILSLYELIWSWRKDKWLSPQEYYGLYGKEKCHLWYVKSCNHRLVS